MNTADYVKALGQLLNEYEYHTNDHSKQKMVNLLFFFIYKLFISYDSHFIDQTDLDRYIYRKTYFEKLEAKMMVVIVIMENIHIYCYLIL